jgi:hypothetical protein
MFGMHITTNPTELPARRPGYFTGVTVRLRDEQRPVAVIEREGKGDALIFNLARASCRMTPVYRAAALARLGDAARPLAWIGLPFDQGGPAGVVRWGPHAHGIARWSERPGVPGTYTTYDTEHETYVELALMFLS